MGQVCTQAQADAWLEEEYDKFEAGVLKLVKGKATPNQLGALVSFAYNLGLGAFGSSTLLKKHLAGKYGEAKLEFARWNKEGTRVLAGLTRRRAAEAKLYAS
jgi:lysozyme